MAKNTHAQEASSGDSASFTEDELNDPVPPPIVTITRMNLGGEVSSPVQVDGGDYSESSGNAPTSSKLQNSSPQSRAHTTENPSSVSPTQDSDGVDTTAGHGQTTETESDDPFQVAADEVIPVEKDDEESEEESTEPTVTAPKPAPRGKRATRKPSTGNPKDANVRSTGDDFDF